MIVSKKQINWPNSILKCRELAIHFSVEYVCDFVYQVNATYISVTRTSSYAFAGY